MIASGAEGFDRIAESYDASLPAHIRAHYRAKRVAVTARLRASGAVLDVGCGTGELTADLAARGYDVVGVDDSLGMLRVAERRGLRRLVQGSGAALPFRSGRFDVVLSVATLHHVVDRTAVGALLGEMVRVVKPGGSVLVWDHNPRNPYWPSLMRRLPQDQHGYRLVSLAEIVDGLGAAGARDVRVAETGWVPEFVPVTLMPLARLLERALERTPVVRAFGAHHVVVAVKSGVDR